MIFSSPLHNSIFFPNRLDKDLYTPLVKGIVYDQLFYVGSVPMFLSFFIVAILTHCNNWDPILDFLKYNKDKLCSSENTTVVSETAESEALIEPGTPTVADA